MRMGSIFHICHPRACPTGVRFKLLDKLHGIDSTHVQAFRDDLDTRLEPKPCDTKIAYFIK